MTNDSSPGPDPSRDTGSSPDAPSISEAFAQAARRSGLAKVAPGETPTASSLLSAMGGVRGLVESILPGFGFLLIYAITKDLVLSVLAPVALSVVFVLVRLVTRSPVMPAIAGLLGVGISAGLALFTGRAEDNFVLGIGINIACLVILLVSLVARRPFIGVIVGLLTSDSGWRTDPAKFRVVLISTWCWVGLFAVRLAVELPLYLTAQTELLAGAKLVLGVPFYAAMLWVTWLLVRTAFARGREQPSDDPAAR